MKKRSYFKNALRRILGDLHREIKIAITPIPRNKKWIFIVGCYNSGTTLLDKLMSEHEEISALPTEGHFITDQFVKDYEIGLPRMWVDREDIFSLKNPIIIPDPERIKKEWASRLNTSKQCLLEKSPPNSARTLWLQEHFENSHFIIITRDPYAVSEGIRRKAEPMHLLGKWPIEKCANQWARNYEVLLKDSGDLERCIWVKYEDLCENTLGVLNRIYKFIGVSDIENIDVKSLKIHERLSEIKNMNNENISNLTFDEIDKITSVVRPIAKKLGYKVIAL